MAFKTEQARWLRLLGFRVEVLDDGNVALELHHTRPGARALACEMTQEQVEQLAASLLDAFFRARQLKRDPSAAEAALPRTRQSSE